jgi:sugar phosphate isomerase/epimerase
MFSNINLCTSVLPEFSFSDAVEIAAESGYRGIELRVKQDFHQTLEYLERSGPALRNQLEKKGLHIPVLNSYLPIEDEKSVTRLIHCGGQMSVPLVRVVLPRSARSAVAGQSREKEIIPSYDAKLGAAELFHSVRSTMYHLESKARAAGIKILVELHWGTIMSSFTAADRLLSGLDPDCIGITFDPANMIVEGKEDWEFGLQLNQERIANVHVKNAAWTQSAAGWRWHWTSLRDGMVDWSELIALLDGIGYIGDYAIEDFLTPRQDKRQAIEYLARLRRDLKALLSSNVAAAA